MVIEQQFQRCLEGKLDFVMECGGFLPGSQISWNFADSLNGS